MAEQGTDKTFSVTEDSRKDPASGLLSREYLQERLWIEFKRAKRYEEEIAALMIGVDAPAWSSADGAERERLYRTIGDVIRQSTRDIDISARWGERTFVAVLPHSGLFAAGVVADKIRGRLARKRLRVGSDATPVTVSIGAACFPSMGVVTEEELLLRAEEALGVAQAQGVDRVEEYFTYSVA